MNDLELWSKFLDVFFIKGSENVVLGELPVGPLEPVKDFDKVPSDCGNSSTTDVSDFPGPHPGTDVFDRRLIPGLKQKIALWRALLCDGIEEAEELTIRNLVVDDMEEGDNVIEFLFRSYLCDVTYPRAKYTLRGKCRISFDTHYSIAEIDKSLPVSPSPASDIKDG